MNWRRLLLGVGILVLAGCSNKTVIYGDHNYKDLSKAREVIVKFTDGNTVRFHHMEIVAVDEKYIYARCWTKKDASPKELKFAKNEVLIEDTEFSMPNTLGYVLSFAITVGILYLLQRLIYD